MMSYQDLSYIRIYYFLSTYAVVELVGVPRCDQDRSALVGFGEYIDAHQVEIESYLGMCKRDKKPRHA